MRRKPHWRESPPNGRKSPVNGKTTTKVPGPFVVEMTFAQIKPAKTNLPLFGMLWQRSEPAPKGDLG